MKVVLTRERLERIIEELVDKIKDSVGRDVELAVIGIRSRGEVLAGRLSRRLAEVLQKDVDVGTLDITLYRDDLNLPQGGRQPEVRTTEIGFSIDDKIIVLADDVLHTGRSARAAMDALVDLGRPMEMRLAVLVERAGRELPIQADYVGYEAKVEENEVVQVRFKESDGSDEVVIEKRR